MGNKNYIYSANKEREIKKQLEEEGYFATRSAGSHTAADVIAIKPTKCGHANHFIVRFIQIKTSISRKKSKIDYEVVDSPCGLINIEMWKIVHKTKSKRKER